MTSSIGNDGTISDAELEGRLLQMMRRWSAIGGGDVQQLREVVERIPPYSLGRKWQIVQSRRQDPLETPLILAARLGWEEGASLIARAVPVESLSNKCRIGCSALFHAIMNSLEDLTDLLLERMPKTALLIGENDDWSPLSLAAGRQSPALTKRICELIGPELIEKAGVPEALLACNMATLEVLLEYIPIDTVATATIEGQNVFHWAARQGDFSRLQLLATLLPEETLWAQDDNGETPLFFAISSFGGLSCAQLLVELMPESALALANKRGNTALHCAAERLVPWGNVIARLLISKLPREVVTLRNNDGCSAEDLLRRRNPNLAFSIASMPKGAMP